MEGRCRRCGEKLSLLQRLQGQDFCSPEHKAEFQREQEEMALARLQQTATNLKKPEMTRTTAKTPLRDSSTSHSAIELRRETEPPMAGFFDDWTSSAQIPPLPPELREEELTVSPRFPRAGAALLACASGFEQIPPVPRVQRGDIITILSPRTVSVVPVVSPVIPARMFSIEGFAWEATALILDEGPAQAGAVPLRAMQARVHEPMVRWMEPFEIDFAGEAARKPPPDRNSVAALEPRVLKSLLPLDELVRACDMVAGPQSGSGADVPDASPAFSGEEGDRQPDTRLEPALAGTVAARVRFGFRRPRRQRIQAAPEELQTPPVVSSGRRSILSAMLNGPAGLARRSQANAAKASAKPLPHFSAVPVPVRPQGFDYAPDLHPIAITSSWLAPPVALPVTAASLPSPSAGSPCLMAEFSGIAPSRAIESRTLDELSAAWTIPPVAREVRLQWEIRANTAVVPAGPEQHQEFTSIPRVVTLITSMRAVVPSMRRRIKMEVHLEPPQPAPWFEPLTCAFGGDPYGSR